MNAVCRRLSADEHEIEDGVQETFVRAYINLRQLKDARQLGPWLRRVAHSVCVNRLKQRSSRSPWKVWELRDLEAAEIPDANPGPDRLAEAKELADAVLCSIARLPETYREPIRLFYIEGDSGADIADRLGLQAGSVRTRLSRGRELLRSDLAGYGPIEAASRTKELRGWLPAKLSARETTEMRLAYQTTRRCLLRSDTEVTIRPMTRGDVPALRRFDQELAPDEWNAQLPPDGALTYPGGPWSDDQELLEHFNKYAERGNMTLLAEEDSGRIVGFADLWAADEPAPFGRSLDVECIDYFREYFLAGLETLLLAEAENVARAAKLPVLDIGTNTCSGDYVSLRRFGLKVFYEYDEVLCKCNATAGGDRPKKRMLTPDNVDLTGLIRSSHWSPTDFTFRGDEERAYIAELTWPDTRAVLELWRYEEGRDDLPVPENPPNKTEVYVEPSALSSPETMSEILAACAVLAAEAGAEQITLPCPSNMALEEKKLDIIERQFRFAWLRKKL